MAKKLTGYDRQYLQALGEYARGARDERLGNTEKCTTKGISRSGDQTASKTASGSVGVATPRLTALERTRLEVIRREVSRGFFLTMDDCRWLVELTSFIP